MNILPNLEDVRRFAASGEYNLYQFIGEINPDIRVIRNDELTVARYHSLAVDEDTLPECLRVTARTVEGEVMAVEHREYPIYGLQFHPESIMTPDGKQMIAAFIR